MPPCRRQASIHRAIQRVALGRWPAPRRYRKGLTTGNSNSAMGITADGYQALAVEYFRRYNAALGYNARPDTRTRVYVGGPVRGLEISYASLRKIVS